jgi:hypothetical protein
MTRDKTILSLVKEMRAWAKTYGTSIFEDAAEITLTLERAKQDEVDEKESAEHRKKLEVESEEIRELSRSIPYSIFPKSCPGYRRVRDAHPQASRSARV